MPKQTAVVRSAPIIDLSGCQAAIAAVATLTKQAAELSDACRTLPQRVRQARDALDKARREELQILAAESVATRIGRPAPKAVELKAKRDAAESAEQAVRTLEAEEAALIDQLIEVHSDLALADDHLSDQFTTAIAPLRDRLVDEYRAIAERLADIVFVLRHTGMAVQRFEIPDPQRGGDLFPFRASSSVGDLIALIAPAALVRREAERRLSETAFKRSTAIPTVTGMDAAGVVGSIR